MVLFHFGTELLKKITLYNPHHGHHHHQMPWHLQRHIKTSGLRCHKEVAEDGQDGFQVVGYIIVHRLVSISIVLVLIYI